MDATKIQMWKDIKSKKYDNLDIEGFGYKQGSKKLSEREFDFFDERCEIDKNFSTVKVYINKFIKNISMLQVECWVDNKPLNSNSDEGDTCKKGSSKEKKFLKQNKLHSQKFRGFAHITQNI